MANCTLNKSLSIVVSQKTKSIHLEKPIFSSVLIGFSEYRFPIQMLEVIPHLFLPGMSLFYKANQNSNTN